MGDTNEVNDENCTHDCSTCGANCPSRTSGIEKEPANELSRIKHVIAVVSGKGGVGKSTVTSVLAAELNRKGYKVGILDADITGPSIPQAFGLHGRAMGSELGIYPEQTPDGIRVISINMLLDDPSDPVVWRGPILGGVVKQFWNEVIWDELDYLLVDMPPGTGDVPLTVFQSLPVDGAVIVSTPQGLVEMIVAKAAKMAAMMDIPVLAMVENMSFLKCPDCGKEMAIFGESRIGSLAAKFGVDTTARLPIVPEYAKAVDEGTAEKLEAEALAPVIEKLASLPEKQ